MTERKTMMQGGTESGKRHAVIVRAEEMFGNIRIRCPSDGTEHEIPKDAKEFICPIDEEVLIIGGSVG